MFELHSRIDLPRPRPEVFAFFAEAGNLERITPDWLGFEVLTPRPVEMGTGVTIDYRLRLHGIPLRWRSEITTWEPPAKFVDEQRRGPYRTWIHRHRFEMLDEGTTRVRDHVLYDHFGGRWINRLLVARDLDRIFAHRRAVLQEVFGSVDWIGSAETADE